MNKFNPHEYGPALFDGIIAWDAGGIALLLQQGVSPNAVNRHGETALAYAALNGNPEIMRLLIDAGANDSRLPVCEAAESGELENLRFLLGLVDDPTALVNEADEAGAVPLMFAAGNGDAPMVELLLEYGADPMYRGPKSGLTPVEIAEKGGYAEVAARLQEWTMRR